MGFYRGKCGTRDVAGIFIIVYLEYNTTCFTKLSGKIFQSSIEQKSYNFY